MLRKLTSVPMESMYIERSLKESVAEHSRAPVTKARAASKGLLAADATGNPTVKTIRL